MKSPEFHGKCCADTRHNRYRHTILLHKKKKKKKRSHIRYVNTKAITFHDRSSSVLIVDISQPVAIYLLPGTRYSYLYSHWFRRLPQQKQLLKEKHGDWTSRSAIQYHTAMDYHEQLGCYERSMLLSFALVMIACATRTFLPTSNEVDLWLQAGSSINLRFLQMPMSTPLFS